MYALNPTGGSINTRLRATRKRTAVQNTMSVGEDGNSTRRFSPFPPVRVFITRRPTNMRHNVRAQPAASLQSREKHVQNNYARRIVPAYYTTILPV